MNETTKLLLTVAIGGTVLGAGLSGYVPTIMKPGPEADWRDHYRPAYSDSSMQYVDAGPIDLSPTMTWPGAPGYQQTMFQEPLDQRAYHDANYGYDTSLGTSPAMTQFEDAEPAIDLAAPVDTQPASRGPTVQRASEEATTAAATLREAPAETADTAPFDDRRASLDSSTSTAAKADGGGWRAL